VEGEMPFAERTKEGVLIWSGKPIEIFDAGGVKKTLVVLDSRLTNPEKIATAFHELVHTRGILNERKAQIETIRGLIKMMDAYPELLENEMALSSWKFQEGSLEVLTGVEGNPKTLIDAVNYAIRSRGEFDVTLTDIKRILKER
jgi:hypothetical protein